jgi:release factor glutamine methyltransferase
MAAATAAKSTPSYYHVLDDKVLRDNVYEPEADSFLLLDALDAERGALAAQRPLTAVEFGPGSGIAITHLAMIVAGGADAAAVLRCTAIDVNPVALRATRQTFDDSLSAAARRRITLDLFRGDLSTAVRQFGASSGPAPAAPAEGPFDVVVFNPPYVPTSAQELSDAANPTRNNGHWLNCAWAGGPEGRTVVDRFLLELPRLLSAGGAAYVVALEENDIPAMIAVVADGSAGAITGEIILSRFTGERLRIIKFSRC